MISRLRHLRCLQSFAILISHLYILDDLVNLRGLSCQTACVNFLAEASKSKAVQRLSFLRVTFGRHEALKVFQWYNEGKKENEIASFFDITPRAATPLPLLKHLCIDKPKKLKIAAKPIPVWAAKLQPTLLPPWATTLAPNLTSLRFPKYSLRSEAPRAPYLNFAKCGCEGA